jgi:hypothetical protein
MRCSRVTISGCRTVGPETVATAFGGSRRAETASDSSNRLASLSLGLSEPSAHRLATGDALHVLWACRFAMRRQLMKARVEGGTAEAASSPRCANLGLQQKGHTQSIVDCSIAR